MSSDIEMAPHRLATPPHSVTDAEPPHAATVTFRDETLPVRRRGAALPSRSFLLRSALLAAFTLIAFGALFYQVGLSIVQGSRLAYLAVLPLLIVMIAFGCYRRPRGVADSESDWLLALILGGFGLVLHNLMDARLPTLSGLWHLHLLGAVIWAGFASTILFGIRRVAGRNMWPMWVFALFTVTPLPYLMLTEWLGGSNMAGASVAAVLGAIAVFLAGKRSALHRRLAAAVVCALAGVGLAAVFAERSLLLAVVVAAGVVPVVVFVLLEAFAGGTARHRPPDVTPLPRRSLLSMAVLACVAAMLAVSHMHMAVPPPAPPRADAGWEQRAGLTQTGQFDFIRGYLGPDATFVRYRVPPVDGFPQAVVDVITTEDLASLRVLRDVVWYPVEVMPNYTPVAVGNAAITDARAAASDSSAVTQSEVDNWHCVTWIWRVGSTYQQVFVVVDQEPSAKVLPAVPQPLSLHDTVAAPALWISRQQANPSAEVDAEVTARSQQVVSRVITAGAPSRD